MRIGLTGAHRSGKTTLAKLIAKQHGLKFIESPASKMARVAGFDLGKDNRLDTGHEMQAKIMSQVVTNLSQKTNFVADRTPIDVAAYMLADATAGAGNLNTRELAVQMVEKAIRYTELLFDIVILVPPVIDFIAEAGKPPENQAYQEHHHMLCRGILFDEDLDLYWDEIRRDTFSLKTRMDFINATIAQWQKPESEAA